MSGIDLIAGELLIYDPSHRRVDRNSRPMRDVLFVLEQLSSDEALVLRDDGQIGRFMVRSHSGGKPWDWTMSCWERF